MLCGLQELSDEIEDYTQRFNTEDQLEWNLVLQEVAAFIEVIQDLWSLCNTVCGFRSVYSLCSVGVEQADPVVVLNDNNSVFVTSNRLQEGSVPPLEQGMVVGQLVLADALIVGNCNNQVLTHLRRFTLLDPLLETVRFSVQHLNSNNIKPEEKEKN